VLRNPGQVLENRPVAPEHRLHALTVNREHRAVLLGIHGRLLRSLQEPGAFAEDVARGQHGNCHHTRGLFDDHPDPPFLDEKDRVSRVALADDHLAARDGDAPHAPGESPQDPFRKREQDRGSFEHGDPVDHVVVRGPAVFGVLAKGWRRRSTPCSAEYLSRAKLVLRPHGCLWSMSSQQ